MGKSSAFAKIISAIQNNPEAVRQYSTRPILEFPSISKRELEVLTDRLTQAKADMLANGTTGDILFEAIFICLAMGDGTQALSYVNRYKKRYVDIPPTIFAEAIGLFLTKKELLAQRLVLKLSKADREAIKTYDTPYVLRSWFELWFKIIDAWKPITLQQSHSKKRLSQLKGEKFSIKKDERQETQPVSSLSADRGHTSVDRTPPLASINNSAINSASINKKTPLPISYNIKEYQAPVIASAMIETQLLPRAVLARYSLEQLKLQRNFEELLFLNHLSKDVQHFWYQLESVKRVLKYFQGRVLFADEVGLGKTIESCMTLKEYILRGMVKSCCIITPATLVNQWQIELKSKFGLDFATNYQDSSGTNSEKDSNINWWQQQWLIVSLPTARRAPFQALLQERSFDLVIVDEAHHLKNRHSKNWQLVNGLKTRYLFLLSATPLQNNLVELYNLLSLLKPGLFKTESEFKQRYASNRNKQSPLAQNIPELQTLMREVMIRNTRSLVDVRLPLRHARTIRVKPAYEEEKAYSALSSWIVEQQKLTASKLTSMTARLLLQQAGSAPQAILTALLRFADRPISDTLASEALASKTLDPASIIANAAANDAASSQGVEEDALEQKSVHELIKHWSNCTVSAKQQAFLELILKNPTEKKLVFVQFKETIKSLESLLTQANIEYATFHGSLTSGQKALSLETFRDSASVLLCSESAGEGHNLQFCNTLINFDIPWNPQIIEQRIGRLHRIGQEREVFVFNLAVENTIEERILHILDEKLNMFELVVGEMQAILGEIEDEGDLSTLIYDTWCEETAQGKQPTLENVEVVLRDAQNRYSHVNELSDKIFGRELEVI